MKQSPAYSFLLNICLKLSFPLLVIVSLFFLFRGHNLPGGGFIGGLVMATSFALISLGASTQVERSRLPLSPLAMVNLGLLLSFISGFWGLLHSGSYLTGVWTEWRIPLIGKFSSTLIFDIGVFLVVTGTIVQILLLLKVEDEEPEL